MSKTLLVMAGGTGGHVFPGLAVADLLARRGWKIVWMGNPDSFEARTVPPRGYEMAWVRFGALRGKGLLRKLLLPVALLSGFWQALREIRRIKPDVVLGMGGYVSFPGGMMAVLLNRPLVIHEQNSIAGLANRVLSKVADKLGMVLVCPSYGLGKWEPKSTVTLVRLALADAGKVVPLDSKDLWVTANFKETQLKDVRPGQPVDIEVDTFPGHAITGTVESIQAGTGSVFSLFPSENASGNYVKIVQRIPVKIVFDKSAADKLPQLRLGMSVVPVIHTN